MLHVITTRTANHRSAVSPRAHASARAGIRDIVLFRGLVPNTGGEYAGVIIGCLLLGVLATFLRTLRGVCESRERILRSQVRLRWQQHRTWIYAAHISICRVCGIAA